LRILVADDQEAVTKSVCSTLGSRADFKVCAEAANGKEAVEKAKTMNPELIIFDITMPLLNGLEAARIIRMTSSGAPILILSVHKSKQLIEEAKKIGVREHVTKADAGLVWSVPYTRCSKITLFPLRTHDRSLPGGQAEAVMRESMGVNRLPHQTRLNTILQFVHELRGSLLRYSHKMRWAA